MALMEYRSTVRVPRPLVGMVDLASGRASLLMGMDGILMRDVNGEYWWIPVGEFRRRSG